MVGDSRTSRNGRYSFSTFTFGLFS
jgi:hypothetical protein